jgi:diguanylate cyclase (GGDEF)-like protein
VDSSNRQMINLRDLAKRVDSDEGLTGMLAVAMRVLVVDGEFSAVAVSVVRDGTDCETLAAAGKSNLHAVLVGSRFPVASFQTELACAEAWGVLRFVPIEHSAQIGVLHPARAEVADLSGISGTLYAQLTSDSGQLIGMISIEIDGDPRQPGIVAQRIISDISEVVANAIEKQLGLADAAPEPSELPAAEAVAEPLADVIQLRDPDTGLANREGLDLIMSDTLEQVRTDGGTAALLYLVLEEFDSIAETLGTEVANEVMRRVSRRLQDTVRGHDVVARVSENTMAIVAGKIAPQDTNSLVSRLRRTLAKVHIVEDEVIRVRGSVGVAIVNRESTDVASTLRIAEKACETARNDASSTYVLYSRYARAPFATPQLR